MDRRQQESGKGAPLPRDLARFRFLSPDRRPELPDGLSGTLPVISTYELVHGLGRDADPSTA